MILPLSMLDKSDSHLELIIPTGELFMNVITIIDLLMDRAATVR